MDEGRKKLAKHYSQISQTVSLIETFVKLIMIFLYVTTGLSSYIESLSLSITGNKYFALTLFLMITTLAVFIIFLPVDYYFGFRLERRFGLSNQSLKSWFSEHIKGFAVGILLLMPIVFVFYWLLINEVNWWIYAATLISIYSVIITKLAPLIIFPLFYKFTPIEEGELKKRITDMCEKAGFKVNGVYSFNMSKTTKKANAALAGIGKTKRIILADTLIENFTEDEIETVFAHELGHYRKKHIIKNILFSIFMIFLILFLTSQIYDLLLPFFGFTSPSEIAALPLLSLILSFLFLILSPISSGISRKFEFEADQFALQTTGNLNAFVSTFSKLADQNLTDDEPNKIYEFWFHSHPSIKKRINAAQAFQQNH